MLTFTFIPAPTSTWSRVARRLPLSSTTAADKNTTKCKKIREIESIHNKNTTNILINHIQKHRFTFYFCQVSDSLTEEWLQQLSWFLLLLRAGWTCWRSDPSNHVADLDLWPPCGGQCLLKPSNINDRSHYMFYEGPHYCSCSSIFPSSFPISRPNLNTSTSSLMTQEVH